MNIHRNRRIRNLSSSIPCVRFKRRGFRIPRGTKRGRGIAFARISAAALAALPRLLERWLPGGKRCGREFIALNPTRTDRTPGSFRINVDTCRWADFATGDKGGDAVSLWAYLTSTTQAEAALYLAGELGVDPYAAEVGK